MNLEFRMTEEQRADQITVHQRCGHADCHVLATALDLKDALAEIGRLAELVDVQKEILALYGEGARSNLGLKEERDGS